jgi:hypothetical protein
MPEQQPESKDVKVDLLWKMYELLDKESSSLEKEMLRSFVYAAIVIGIPFGIGKIEGVKFENVSYFIPFAFLLLYYYYLTLMYFVICISIHKAGIEKKINTLLDQDGLLNYNSAFTKAVYGDVFLPWKNKKIVPAPNLVLAVFILAAIFTVTLTGHLLRDWWLALFCIICFMTALITLYVFFYLEAVINKKWNPSE